MQIHRNYKYRLYPNKKQIDLLNHHFFSSNQAWNYMLDFKIKELKNQSNLEKSDRKYTNFNDLYENTKVDLKSRGIIYNSGVVQDKMRALDSTFKLFYTKKSEGQGFPKFRTSKGIQQSFVIRNQATSWTNYHLKIFKSPIKWNFHRPIPSDAKFNGGVVKRESDGKYYVVLNLTIEYEYHDYDTGIECGLDLNVKNIAISSNDGISKLLYLEDFLNYQKPTNAYYLLLTSYTFLTLATYNDTRLAHIISSYYFLNKNFKLQYRIFITRIFNEIL